MNFIGVRELRSRPAQIWERLSKEKEMVITSNGKPIAVLSFVNEKTLEDSLCHLRKVRAMMAVEAMQEHSMKLGLHRLSLKEINEEIQETRRARASR